MMSEGDLEIEIENESDLSACVRSAYDNDLKERHADRSLKEENNNVPFCEGSQSAHAEVPDDYVQVLCADLKRIQQNYNVRLKFSICVEGKSESDVDEVMQYLKERIANRPIWAYNNVGSKGNRCDREKTESKVTGECISDASKKKTEQAHKRRWEQCVPLLKNFYKESSEVASLSADLIVEMRLENENTTLSRLCEATTETAEGFPNPIWKLEHCFESYSDLLAQIRKQGLVSPTAIQAQAWPILLKGEDLICVSQTGKGKTLAFLLPALIHTEYQTMPRDLRGGPNVLVLAATRELALEIEKEANKYAFRGIKTVCLYAGGNRREQINSLKKGVQVIICTPGRLMDLMRTKVIDLTSVTYAVLTEVDCMLDMGFESQITKVLLDIRPDRQTVMTCATLPPALLRLAQAHMNKPVKLIVGSMNLVATENVNQIVQVMDEVDKLYTIKSFVEEMSPADKVVIYCRKTTRARELTNDFIQSGYVSAIIHGESDQAERGQAIADITAGVINILIITDVASNGLAFKNITHIINFDFPRNMPDYMHRVALAAPTGTCLSFVTPADAVLTTKLINLLEAAHQVVPDDLRSIAAGTWKKRCIKEIARARKLRWSKCPRIFKNFYNEHTEVANMSHEEVAQLRLENNNTAVFKLIEEGAGAIPNPVWKFEHCFDLYPDLLEQIYKQKLEQPSAIQAQVWPILLRGEDLVCISSSAADKSLAFLLPALVHIEYQSIPREERGGPNVLILAPTRDLSLSIEKTVSKYAFRGIKALCIYGGDRRVCHLKSGVQMLICTPGRLVDLVRLKLVDLASITYVVLAEADRLVAKGAEFQIRKILLDIRPDRQTVITSSSWPPGVRRLARLYTENPVQVCFDEAPIQIEEPLVKEL